MCVTVLRPYIEYAYVSMAHVWQYLLGSGSKIWSKRYHGCERTVTMHTTYLNDREVKLPCWFHITIIIIGGLLLTVLTL